jgi:aminomethyltransferase
MNPASLQIEPTAESATALHALLHGAAAYSLADRGWIRVTGSDRVRWLNGMVTNSIQQLAPGVGCYNFLLSAQGRIEGDANVFNIEDSLLIQTDRTQSEHMLAWLDHYIIMDDVELTPINDLAGIGIAGRQATSLLENLFTDVALPEPLGITPPFLLNQTEIRIVTAHSPLVPRYELWTSPENLPALQKALNRTTQASDEAVEWLRLLEGTPRYGTDIRNTADRHDLPQETAQARTLHFTKGCYLGQEIVERIRSRGNVHRSFSGFLIHGDTPAAGAVILSEEKAVGEITSAARIPLTSGAVTLALGYIRREAIDLKSTLTCNGLAIDPVPLPYSAI